MEDVIRTPKVDKALVLGVFFLLTFSVLILRSIAPDIFPNYLLYILLAIIFFYIFSKLEFEVLALFHKHLYVMSILLLILPLLIGQATRGAVRWIPLGAITIQPAEVVKPFLVLFLSVYLNNKMTPKMIMLGVVLLAIPVFLVLVQPSLGVALLTLTAFLGVLLASRIDKRLILLGGILFGLAVPFSINLLAPYQRERIITFLFPGQDPHGAGYNSIQSMISVGSGRIIGRGLGEGVQTQLSFLPERHTDFVFASIAEELGFVGAFLILTVSFFVLYRVIKALNSAISFTARAFISGIFFMLFSQVLINIGMNMGLLPVTGIPLPLVSAGGSSLLATMISLGMVNGAKKKI